MKLRGMGERLALMVLSTFAMFLGSCPASWSADPTAAESALDRGSLRLIGRFNAGHACAIAPRVALTNGHIVDLRPFDAGISPYPFAWSDGSGAAGFLVPTRGGLERGRDLAAVEPYGEGSFPHYLPLASAAPKPGDRVFFLGYDWSNRKKAMGDEVVEAKVTRVVALHVVFIPSGQPGSSGSCVVNEAGEVVAINEGGYPSDDGETVGIAIGVYGGLHKAPE